MASICNRCALRLQRASNTTAQSTSKRAFSQSATRSRHLPTFTETSNADLNNILATLRTQHVIPAFLNKAERKLIFAHKNKQYLEANPQTTNIGEEEVNLQWLDRNGRPLAHPLVKQALKMILETKDNTWDNLPQLLRASREGTGFPVSYDQMEWIVRKAFEKGKVPVLFRCLQQSESTGMSLKAGNVLRCLVFGIREKAQNSGWEKNHVANALHDFHKVMTMLESEQHGGGNLKADDARRRPEVLGTLLELSAVHAYKHAGAEDANGVVKTYAERLLSILESNPEKYTSESAITLKPEKVNGPHWNMVLAVPVYHGLLLAHKILGESIPRSDSAKQFISQYQMVLERLATELEAKNPEKGTYDAQALTAWKKCIRD